MVRWEHKVVVNQVLEHDLIRIEALDNIRMLDLRENLLLILCLVNLAMKFLVQLYDHLRRVLLVTFADKLATSNLQHVFVFFAASVHNSGKGLKVTSVEVVLHV